MRARDLTGGGASVAQDEGPAAEAEHSACLLRTVVAPRGGLTIRYKARGKVRHHLEGSHRGRLHRI